VRLIFRRFRDLGSALLVIRELNVQGHRTKSWTTQAGTFRESRPFDKGTIYKIVRNRTYLGEPCTRARAIRASTSRSSTCRTYSRDGHSRRRIGDESGSTGRLLLSR
jgi:Recombinase